jgi:Ca2+-binding EF-hand superfamily protein
MKRILTATAIVALAAMAAAPALAATAVKPAPKPAVHKVVAMKTAAATPAKPTVVTFKTLDANKDGKISYAELKKFWPKLTKAGFAAYDANKDGFYNHAELAAFAKANAPAKPSK